MRCLGVGACQVGKGRLEVELYRIALAEAARIAEVGTGEIRSRAAGPARSQKKLLTFWKLLEDSSTSRDTGSTATSTTSNSIPYPIALSKDSCSFPIRIHINHNGGCTSIVLVRVLGAADGPTALRRWQFSATNAWQPPSSVTESYDRELTYCQMLQATSIRSIRQLAPLLDRVLVQRVKAEAKTASGIFLPESSVEKLNEAKVVAVGPGALDKSGNRLPMGVAAGDRVLIPQVCSTRNHPAAAGLWHCAN